MATLKLVYHKLVSLFQLVNFGVIAIFSLSPFPLNIGLATSLKLLDGQLALAVSLVDFADPLFAVLFVFALLFSISFLPPAQFLLKAQLKESLLLCFVFV